MPYSSHSGKDYIKRVVSKIKRDRVLDVGCGSGTYARMFPDATFVGVEVWEPYVAQFGLNDLYEKIIVADARTVDYKSLGRFDVAFLGDVLEHMEKEEAKKILDQVKEIADAVIVSIPIGYYPQDEYEGNQYQIHVTDNWTDEDFRATFGEPTAGYIENEIGVYYWLKNKPRPKICVYAISKNEEAFVERFAASAKDADLIFVADTGSSDNTIQACKDNGVSVHSISIMPWRFDLARNVALALIPSDIDICISLDLDEVLEPGWRQEVERLWTLGTTRMRYLFDWSNGLFFKSEKIHARSGYHWHHPCHEIIVPDARSKEAWVETDKMLVRHLPDPGKGRGQYLELLEISVKEDPHCPRNAFYYARELSFYGRLDEAIAACEKYLLMPGATWSDERAYAMRVIGKCHEAKGDGFKAEASYWRAAFEAPHTREPHVALAQLYHNHRNWAACYASAHRALVFKEQPPVYTSDPKAWGSWPHDLLALAAWNLGLREEAVEQGKIALSMDPDDERLRKNLKWFTGEKT